MEISGIKEILEDRVVSLRDAGVSSTRLTGAINKLRIGAIVCREQKLWFNFYSSIRNPAENRNNLYGPWLKSKVAECFKHCNGFVQVEFGEEKSSNEEAGAVKVTFVRTDDRQASQHLEESLRELNLFLNDFKDRTNWDRIKTDIENYNQNHTGELDEYFQRFSPQNSSTPSPHSPQAQQGNPNMINEIASLLKANLNVILTGAPGTGKTYTAKKVAYAITGDTDSTSQEESHIAFVQFHPGYDYSDFVIGMKPDLKDGQVAFDWKAGIFKKFADDAKADPDHNYVFLIDEINRADLSRVFGELFSLLEEEYRYCKEDGVEKNAKGVTLPDGTNFVIPKNLYIIGTMNDIDRSVESMDFALRRRFAWKEVTADESKYILYAAGKGGFRKVTDIDAKKLECAMDELNKVIGGSEKLKVSDENYNQQDCELRLGSEYQLGAAIFAKLEKYVGRDTNGNPEKATSAAFNSLWNNHIKNILSEYLRGRPGRDKKLLPALREIFNAAVNDASKKEEEPKAEENVHESNAPDAVNLQQN